MREVCAAAVNARCRRPCASRCSGSWGRHATLASRDSLWLTRAVPVGAHPGSPPACPQRLACCACCACCASTQVETYRRRHNLTDAARHAAHSCGKADGCRWAQLDSTAWICERSGWVALGADCCPASPPGVAQNATDRLARASGCAARAVRLGRLHAVRCHKASVASPLRPMRRAHSRPWRPPPRSFVHVCDANCAFRELDPSAEGYVCQVSGRWAAARSAAARLPAFVLRAALAGCRAPAMPLLPAPRQETPRLLPCSRSLT